MNLLTTEQFQTLIRDAWEQLRRNRLQDDHDRYDVGDLLHEKSAIYDYWNPLIGEFDVHYSSKLVHKNPQVAKDWEEEYGDYFEYHMRPWDPLFKSCRIDRHMKARPVCKHSRPLAQSAAVQ